MKEQSLVEKIIADAQEKANYTVADAERAAADIARKTEQKIQIAKEEQLELTAKKNAELVERKKINARIDSNKVILKAKTEIVDEVFERSLAMLADLGKDDYVTLLNSLIEKYAEYGDELILSSACRYREEINALPVINRLFLKTGAVGDFAGGALLIGAASDKNVTFEALIQRAKEERQTEIAEKIFG